MNENKLKKYIKKIEKLDCFSIFLEKTHNKEIVEISIYSPKEKSIIYFDCSNNKKKNKFNIKFVLSNLKPYLENSNIKKIGYDFKSDYLLLKKENISLSGIYFDTMLGLYIIDPFLKKETEKEKKKHIDFLTEELLNNKNHVRKKSKINFYLYKKINYFLKKDKISKKIFEKIDIPIISVIARMEMNGILIDKKILKKQLNEINKKLSNTKKNIQKLEKEKFNFSSNKQTIQILLKRNLILDKKTKKGKISIDKSVLKRLSKNDPFPKNILKYRSLKKTKSNYIIKLINLINEKTKKIHTSYYQTTTISGRISSKSPNLQNIPVKKQEDRKIRKSFIPTKGNVLLSADYSQIELRIIAHLSKDKKLIKNFKENEDVHLLTASNIFSKTTEKISIQQRQFAKIINFCLIYGISDFGLSKKLNISLKNAKKYKETYYKKYKKIPIFFKKIIKKTKENGYITTITGRKININNINSKNVSSQRSAERQAINLTIQGSVADMLKIAMIKIDKLIQKQFILKAKMLIQIHDELIFEIKKKYVIKLKKYIYKIMKNSLTMQVPIEINIKIGENWNQLF